MHTTFQIQTCLHNRSMHRLVVVFHGVFHCRSVVVFHMCIDSFIHMCTKNSYHTNHTQTYITHNVFQHIVFEEKHFTFTRYTNIVTTRVQNTYMYWQTTHDVTTRWQWQWITNTFDSCTCNGHQSISVRTYTVWVMYASCDTTSHMICLDRADNV